MHTFCTMLAHCNKISAGGGGEIRISLPDFMTPTTRNYRISKRNFPGGTEGNLDRQTYVKGCLSTMRGRCELPVKEKQEN